jgi:hypothetical protein
MKKSKLLLMLLLIFPILFIIWVFTIESNLNKYMKEKYGFKVDMVEREEINTGNMGDVTHKVAVRGKPELVFGIRVQENFVLPGMTVISDEYELGLQAYKDYQEIKPALNKLEDLGFERIYDQNYVSYEKYKDQYIHQLNLKDSQNLTMEMFEDNWLDRYHLLVKTISSMDTNIKDIYLSMNNNIPLRIPNIHTISSKESLTREMNRYNDALATHYLAFEMDSTLKNLENDRFQFKGNHWFPELGVKCSIMDEKGSCAKIDFFLTYEEGGLKADNEMLERDLIHIVDGLNSVLDSETDYGIILKTAVEDGEYFTNQEVKNLKDVRRFIHEKFTIE